MPGRYIGLDLSLSETGVCVLEGDNILESCVVKGKKLLGTERISTISSEIFDILQEFRPDAAAIEGLVGSKFAFTLVGLAKLHGAVAFNIWQNYEGDLRVLGVAPSALKKFATGSGAGKKSAVLLQIYKRWGEEFDNDNAGDAYVLARIAQAAAEPHRVLTTAQKEVLKKITEEK